MKTLSELAIKYNTDKGKILGGHNYIPVYEKILANRQVNSMLEIGLGGGGSIRMWHDYFPDAQIYCMEYGGKEHVEKWKSPIIDIANTTIIFGDSTKLDNWKEIPDSLSLIVDDGSHDPYDQIATFRNGFRKLKSSGLWVIEDVFCGFNAEYKNPLFYWIYDIQQKIQLPNISAPGDYYASCHLLTGDAKDVYSISVYKSLVIVEKG